MLPTMRVLSESHRESVRIIHKNLILIIIASFFGIAVFSCVSICIWVAMKRNHLAVMNGINNEANMVVADGIFVGELVDHVEAVSPAENTRVDVDADRNIAIATTSTAHITVSSHTANTTNLTALSSANNSDMVLDIPSPYSILEAGDDNKNQILVNDANRFSM
jgi:hypothetical protein